MSLVGIDHMVLTVRDLEATVEFYEILGLRRQNFGEGRIALLAGRQKINLHRLEGETAMPKAKNPGPGTADFCVIDSDLDKARQRLEDAGIEILLGPVPRTGARGPIRSIYCRDPDGNLVEIADYGKG